MLAHRLPFPPDKGERIRAFHELLALGEYFQLTLAALAHNEDDLRAADALAHHVDDLLLARVGGPASKLRAGMSLLTGRSATEGFFHSPELLKQLRKYTRTHPVEVVLAYCSSVLPMALTVPAVACLCDLVDVDSAKFRNYAQTAHGPKRWLYRREARTVARLEDLALQTCNAVFLVSAAEASQLPRTGPNVVPVGNGVDTDTFDPQAVTPENLGPAGLVFTGTMDYRPNVEGVCWFVEHVWPELRKQHPQASFTIVGRDPAPAVLQLAHQTGVNVTGSVPDVRPYLRGAALAVCPLLTARGIQNKILEAMAMALPVVATGPALEGIAAEPGSVILRADSPAEWLENLQPLLAEPARRASLGQAARKHVLQHYSWAAQLQPLVKTCRKLTLHPDLPSNQACGQNRT